MPRLFVAVWPPDDVLDQVAAIDRPAVAGLRWTEREQWHVTLRFLGPVPDPGGVVSALEGLEAPAAVARLGPRVDRFGHRILHVPVGGLEAIAAGVVRATAGVQNRHGRPPDDRPFRGHLTLARATKDAPVDLRTHAGAPLAGQWDVADVCLVESHPTPGGARYEVVDRFDLSPAGRRD